MDPVHLVGWERILQSQVAVALLLVAGYAVLGRVIWRLYTDKEEAQRLIREHLAAQAEFDGTIKHVESLLHLVRTHDTLRPALDSPLPPAAPAVPEGGAAGDGGPGAAGPAAAD